ncbi:hypothetical protein PENTCL1PPCAC_29678, partial [Pristionchus entomophagus]
TLFIHTHTSQTNLDHKKTTNFAGTAHTLDRKEESEGGYDDRLRYPEEGRSGLRYLSWRTTTRERDVEFRSFLAHTSRIHVPFSDSRKVQSLVHIVGLLFGGSLCVVGAFADAREGNE